MGLGQKKDSQNQKAILEEGGLQVLTKMMREEKGEVQTAAAMAIQSLMNIQLENPATLVAESRQQRENGVIRMVTLAGGSLWIMLLTSRRWARAAPPERFGRALLQA